MERTLPYTDVNKEVSGYMVNCALSEENSSLIEALRTKLKQNFPDIILTFPKEALHITVMDWVAPLVDYGRSRDDIFNERFREYDAILQKVLAEQEPFVIHFNQIIASEGAVFISGYDNGTMQRIRDEFLQQTQLTPGTKQPPTIIHSSIARYKTESDLKPIQDFCSSLRIDFKQSISELRLVNEKEIPLLKFATLKTYSL